jgi:cytochrome c
VSTVREVSGWIDRAPRPSARRAAREEKTMIGRASNAGLKWALVVGAGALLAAFWSQLAQRSAGPQVVERTLGPANERFVFDARARGGKGPAARCVVCHALERGEAERVAPRLAGIVGAPKARAAWFAYSPALRAKGGVWTEEELDRFLADPRAYAPGTTKIIPGIADEKIRRELIAHLKSLRD